MTESLGVPIKTIICFLPFLIKLKINGLVFDIQIPVDPTHLSQKKKKKIEEEKKIKKEDKL